MTLRYITLFVILLCAITLSCKKPPIAKEISGNYFIYGHTGGFTAPEHRTTYFLVNNGKLWKDVSQLTQAPPADVQQFKFTILCPEQQYNSVADLPSSIPSELLRLNNTTIGSGSMIADGGYTDVRARINGTTYKWTFEANLDSVSQPIREFYARCNTSFR